MRLELAASGLVAIMAPSMASAFSFIAGTPTQCDYLNVTWTGGQAPFYLIVSPAFGTPRNISIPSSAFNNNQGSFATQLDLPHGKEFILAMSDSTGFGTGGTSPVMTVGSSVSGTSCNTTDPDVKFYYQLNSALQQCRSYTFSEYGGAIQPITIFALIPGGETTILRPPEGSSYDWNVDVAAGTTMMFIMVDSQGRQGGASDFLAVGSSDDATCLTGSSPTSTASPSQSSTTTSSATATATETTSANVSIGAIAGTVLGGIIAIAVIVTLGLFFLKKWRDERHLLFNGDGLGSARRRSRRLGSIDLTLDQQYVLPYNRGQASNLYTYPSPNSTTALTPPTVLPPSVQSEPRPFTLPASVSSHTRSNSKTDLDSPFTDEELSQAGRQKAAMAGISAYRPPRFILHTDEEEALPNEEVDIVELPPQYTDRRQTLADVKQPPPSTSTIK